MAAASVYSDFSLTVCILGLYTGMYRSGHFSNHCILQNKHSICFISLSSRQWMFCFTHRFLNRNSASGSGLCRVRESVHPRSDRSQCSPEQRFFSLTGSISKAPSLHIFGNTWLWWNCVNLICEEYAPVLMSFSVTAGVWAFVCVCASWPWGSLSGKSPVSTHPWSGFLFSHVAFS